MSKEDSIKRSQIVQPSGNRRSMLRGIVLGIASGLGISGTASATETKTINPQDTIVEPLDVDIESARNSLKKVISSKLFRRLAEEEYISEPSAEAIPLVPLEGDSQLGGVERLRVNGELEQYNFHIPVGDNRLEIMLPLSDYVPTAYLHQKNAPEIVYAYDNNYRGEELEAESGSVSPQQDLECSPPLSRVCTTCWACCGLDNWSRDEVKVLCPNCWLSKCHWVKDDCC